MINYLVITENDVSQWDDKTGEYYHFPSKYKNKLVEGSKVIYYKGVRKEKKFVRLSDEPHYFGIATIGEIKQEVSSDNKTTYYATINNYIPFKEAVSFKDLNGEYLEPRNDRGNYFRDGVRVIDEDVYKTIVSKSKLIGGDNSNIEKVNISDSESVLTSYGIEGGKKVIYTTKYERDPKLRAAAINFHGTTCMCCDFNFEKSYGILGSGFIHVHHIKPISEAGETLINPEKDLIVLCPNCHAMVHRRRNSTLSLDELRTQLLWRVNYK
ncbi:HNH endonuclease [Myroides odoratimimus]|uniref:HNH endonuclease n=1 Tax=Myroides odoratimimus TaxID=76832 RepID=UPI002576785B|nr:HNH endonuclease [Myroides odoratimimus]MDM1530752.1 HNH endonuclease [Myroides odoratimimus]